MKTLSSLPQDVVSFKPLTPSERREQVRVARIIIREALEIGGFTSTFTKIVNVVSAPRKTSTMGTAHHKTLTIKLSASALWRRASPEKRRNTVVHELAHLVNRWTHGKKVKPHGREWRQIMSAMGEDPKRCHTVPTVPRGGRSRRPRPTLELVASEAPATNFSVGDVVLFGRPRGEKTRAKVIGKTYSRLKLKTLEPRGQKGRYETGSVFTSSPQLCRKVEA